MNKSQKNPVGLVERFGIPPFSVLDAKQGVWLDRKREWMRLGIQSEVGRTARAFNIKEWMDEKTDVNNSGSMKDTSIFDPVLCECIYNWFSPDENCKILDPFAGGSVRGIVASRLGHDYIGIELREEQVLANRIQGEAILTNEGDGLCEWITGDSLVALDGIDDNSQDLIITCPPYGDLEVYSDDPADLSNMTLQSFDEVYAQIMTKAIRKLKPGRFAAVVVGDYRNKKTGFLTNFVSKTVAACENHTSDPLTACGLWNEIILLNNLGSLPLRVAKQFQNNRKIGKGHQNVMVFYKGNPALLKTEFRTLGLIEQREEPDWL
jgi:DNA modification methylase